MKKILFFFLAGILFSIVSCKKNPPPCPIAPTQTGFSLLLVGGSGTQNNYHLDISYEEPNPTPGSYFDVKITPEGQAPKTYKAYTDGLPHQLSNNSLGIAPVEFSVPLSAKTFTVILTGKLPSRIQPFCNCGVPSQAYTFTNARK
jgi:hypothetical protein